MFKYWLIDCSLEDNFESLVEWVELRVQIMEEAKEETSGVRCDRTRARGFTTCSQAKGCIVDTCKQDHPPWVCKTFKELPLLTRRKLISNTGRCYRCPVAGHHSKDCPNVRRCGVHGCTSTNHSSYLHDNTPGQTVDWSQYQLRADASPPRPPGQPQPFQPPGQPHSGIRAPQGTGASVNGPALDRQQHPREQTYSTRHTERVSLMILPALISNGNKELRVNAMLDPCSTSSYTSEEAAEELELHGQSLNLTIAGTGGTEIRKRSHRVELKVANLDGTFLSPLQAHVHSGYSLDGTEEKVAPPTPCAIRECISAT